MNPKPPTMPQPRLAARAYSYPGGAHVVIPGLKLVSELNARECWQAKCRRAKQQRLIVTMLLNQIKRRPALPVVVEVTRIAPRELDSDNLSGSAKHVRDAVATWLGVDDADWKEKRVTWEVRQEYGGVRGYGVKVSFREVVE